MIKQSVFYKFLNRREGVDFSGYLQSAEEDEDYISWNQFVLPNDYGDTKLEYQAIRHSCALFDVSPMRKYQVRGKSAGAFLDYLLTRSVSDAESMQGIYVAYCNEDGSLKDDSILYKFSDEDYLLMPSDMDHSAHFESLCKKLSLDDLSIVDCTDAFAGMAIQGPLSATVLKHMGFEGIELLEPFRVKDYQLGDDPANNLIRIARMGFTADLGYECWMDRDLSTAFEQRISSARKSLDIELPGYGLTALEVCRLEGGFMVAGWDCATEADPQPGFERSPFELAIGWLVNLHAADFVGREALIKEKQEGGRYVRRSFTMNSKTKPDDAAEIWALIDSEEIPIGSVNCSSWSWDMERTIGNASIRRQHMHITQAWLVDSSQRQEIELCRGPLLKLERQSKVPADIID